MEQDEQRHFNSRKALRNSTDWEKTITCSIQLADHLFGPENPIYLATDSNLVKKLAFSKYGGWQIKMVNLTLQHAALTTPKLPWQTKYEGTQNAKSSTNFPEGSGNDSNEDVVNVSGVDGYMATWVDFLLMARASALVHSISGFSVTAYGNPNVTKISKKQTQLCNCTGILDNCKLNCAKVQRSWMLPTQLCKSTKVVDTAISTVQKYKGRGCCQLNCAKVQRSWMLPTQLCKSTKVVDVQSQLCKSTKVVDAAISTVQSYRDIGCCKLNCAKVQRSWMLTTQLCNHVIIDHVHIYMCVWTW